MSDVRDLLDQAESFARAGDVTAAVSRARTALRVATDEESRDAARIAFERFHAEEEAWRHEIRKRAEEHLAREHGAAGEMNAGAAPEQNVARSF